MQSLGRSVTNVWVQLQWYRYSTSTWFSPKMQTASVLLLCHSTENSISDWGLAVWDIALRFFVMPLGTHRCYQTILQPNISTSDFWCHPNGGISFKTNSEFSEFCQLNIVIFLTKIARQIIHDKALKWLLSLATTSRGKK